MTARALAVVAGSGLDLRPVLDTVSRELPFHDAGVGATGVSGHAGRFLFGTCGDLPVIVQLGRRHVYEGLTPAQSAETVDRLHEFGARAVIFTNAAGGLRPELRPGDLVSATALWPAPYRRAPLPECLYPDFTVAGCDATGPYVWVPGPAYETPAEIRMLRALGAAMVGMSTAPELSRCHAHGMPAAAVSCITNNCCVPMRLTHAHVVETAAQTSRRLVALLRMTIARGLPAGV